MWVDDIQFITIGGFSSRFWMLRKHFNSMTPENINLDAPFYAWECLSIDMGNRDVDLVIRNEKHMKYVLKFIISGMRTLDGRKGTANKILDVLNEQTFEKYKQANNKVHIEESIKRQMILENEHMVFKKVYLKYLILKIRAKISYIAFVKKMTIVELFASTILKCYNEQK